MIPNEPPLLQRQVLSPTRLAGAAREMLERGFGLLWIEGELSNLVRSRCSRVNAWTAAMAPSVCSTSENIRPSRSRRLRPQSFIGPPKPQMSKASSGTTASDTSVRVGSAIFGSR